MLSGSRVFSTLYLASRYWQISLGPEAREKTAFVTRYGPLEFSVMPFGLCNAGASFQRCMEKVLHGLQRSTAYTDDILTHNKCHEGHLRDLRDTLERLRKAKLKVKTLICKIGYSKTKFLGFIISEKGVTIDEDRIKAIQEYPTPTT